MSGISPFTMSVSDEQLGDLQARVKSTILPSEIEGADWRYGPPISYLESLRAKLLNSYDWRHHESALNRLPHFTTEIDGQRLHFIHVRSKKPGAVPLLLIHGWPGSFVEFLRVIEPLTNPPASGTETAFDVVIPSLPGFGFSGPTAAPGWNNKRIAQAFVTLMTRLGYERFGVQGGDAGAIIGPEIGRVAPKRVIGVHVNAATMGFIPMVPVSQDEVAEFTPKEQQRLQRLQRFMAEHFSFNAVQSTRPQAIGFALSDSPIGLMAWMSELFASFGDRPSAVDPEMFLTNFYIYWLTNTAASSTRLYHENAHDPSAWATMSDSGVPTGVAVFGFDEVAIRRFAEQSNSITRWTECSDGGHYAVLEVPDLWCGDVRAFFAELTK